MLPFIRCGNTTDDVYYAHGCAGSGRVLPRWAAEHPRLRAYYSQAGYTQRGDV